MIARCRARWVFVASVCLLSSLVAVTASQPGQENPQGGRGGGQGRGGGFGAAYPARAPDPGMVERGRPLYVANCAFCHGQDTRGASNGPSLLRSQLVQDDQNGELIGPVILAGRPPQMPKSDLTPAQIADVAAFLHSFTINSRDPARIRPESILTGNAGAGEAYFKAKCGSCHSVTGDLKGIAGRITDPRSLQQWWLMPGGGGRGRGRGGDAADAPRFITTAAVTLPGGQTVEGRLARLDEFIVSVVEADGTTRTFRRDGETPKVVVRDPLQPHKALLRVYTDGDIHDVTAYLVTLK